DVLDTSVVRYNIYAKQVQEPERFVTALLLDIDDQGRVRVINCGHLPPYVVCPQYAGPAVPHDPSAPLGLGSLVPQARVIQEFSLPPEATLLLCTDGVTEARNRDGKFYPLKERLRGWRNVPAGQLIGRIAAVLAEFTEEGSRDDLTVPTLYRERSAAPLAAPPPPAARRAVDPRRRSGGGQGSGQRDHPHRGHHAGDRHHPGEDWVSPRTRFAVQCRRHHHQSKQHEFGGQDLPVAGQEQRLPCHALPPRQGDTGADLQRQEERRGKNAEPSADRGQQGGAPFVVQAAPGQRQHHQGHGELPAHPQCSAEYVEKPHHCP